MKMTGVLASHPKLALLHTHTQKQLIGGYLLQEGGTLTVYVACLVCMYVLASQSANPLLLLTTLQNQSPTRNRTNSHCWVFRPGVLFREVYTVGGQILVLGGAAVLTGCSFTSSSKYVRTYVGGCHALIGILCVTPNPKPNQNTLQSCL